MGAAMRRITSEPVPLPGRPKKTELVHARELPQRGLAAEASYLELVKHYMGN